MELRFAVLAFNTFVFTVVVITSQPEAAHLKISKQDGGELCFSGQKRAVFFVSFIILCGNVNSQHYKSGGSNL